MGRPQSFNALRFYLTAFQRFEDAEVLLRSKPSRTTGAVYLAGYSVECILKSLVLSVTPRGQMADVEEVITRGAAGHDLEALRERYTAHVQANISGGLTRDFIRWNSWGPRIRYQSGIMNESDAEAFLDSARRILQWADTRL
jgi:hypothetical protein